MILLIVLVFPGLAPIYYVTILTYVFVQVVVSSIRTNRARCTLYKKILDLFDEKSVSGESRSRACRSIHSTTSPATNL